MTTCNKIVAEWGERATVRQLTKLRPRYVCTAERGTEHSHTEGLANGTLRRLHAREHETAMADEYGCKLPGRPAGQPSRGLTNGN